MSMVTGTVFPGSGLMLAGLVTGRSGRSRPAFLKVAGELLEHRQRRVQGIPLLRAEMLKGLRALEARIDAAERHDAPTMPPSPGN